jgi:hypothetical protein
VSNARIEERAMLSATMIIFSSISSTLVRVHINFLQAV